MSAVRIVSRNCSCSVRDWRISATGPSAEADPASGRATAMYSSRPTVTEVIDDACSTAASAARESEGNVEASTCPPATNARLAIVEDHADGETSEIVRHGALEEHWHAHELEHAAGMRPEGRSFLGRRDVREPTGEVRGLVARQSQHAAIVARKHQQIGIDLRPILVGERLDGRRVASLDSGFELRQVGDHACEPREMVRPRRAVLVDEADRFDEPAPQPNLSGRRRPFVDEIEGKAERQRCQQGAGQEDAVRQRRCDVHRPVWKS
jgi:hypothetical protein